MIVAIGSNRAPPDGATGRRPQIVVSEVRMIGLALCWAELTMASAECVDGCYPPGNCGNRCTSLPGVMGSSQASW